MTDYLTLLAQAFCAQRRGHLGTGIMPVHTAIRDALDATGKLPRKADECTDDEVREAFGPGGEQGVPRTSIPPVAPSAPEIFIPNSPGTVVRSTNPEYTTTSTSFVDVTPSDIVKLEYLPGEDATDEDVQAFTDQLNEKPKWKGGK